MGDQAEAHPVQPRAQPGVDQEADGRRGQDPADAAPRGFQHQQDGGGAEHKVDDRRHRRAVRKRGAIEEGPGQGGGRDTGEQAVQAGRSAAASAPGGIEKERRGERDQKEAGPVELGGTMSTTQ